MFPGSWVGHHFDEVVGRTILGNNHLVFNQVVIHDPIEPFMSEYSAWQPPLGAPALEEDQLPLALTLVPSQRSGNKPVLTTALYPPGSKAFMTLTEAHTFNVEPHRTLGIRRALEAIEAWRSLIRDGAVVLAPVFEVTGRSTPAIARIGEARINAVHDVISAADGASALNSFSTRGGYLTPNWENPKLADRAKSRHISWLYGRELAICDAVGALYCPDHVVDLDMVETLATPHVMPVSGDFRRAVAAIDLPGFSDVSLAEIAKLRRDSNAFHAVREKLRTIINNSPTEVDELSSGEQAQAYLNEYLASEIAAIHGEARERGDGLATRFTRSLLSVGLPTAVTAGAAVGAAGGLMASWLARRKFSPGERAVLWIERHVNPVNDEAD